MLHFFVLFLLPKEEKKELHDKCISCALARDTPALHGSSDGRTETWGTVVRYHTTEGDRRHRKSTHDAVSISVSSLWMQHLLSSPCVEKCTHAPLVANDLCDNLHYTQNSTSNLNSCPAISDIRTRLCIENACKVFFFQTLTQEDYFL